MKRALVSLILLNASMLANAAASSPPAFIAAAVADSARPLADTQVDNARKPAELLAFAGIKPGDKVADFIPGGGYFTRLFARVVGPKGHVFAVIPQSLAASGAKRVDPIKEITASADYRNVSLLIQPYDDLGADTPLDIVWTSQNYHDVYGEVGPFVVAGISGTEEAARFDAAAFKALKPGGVFIVIDHAAKAGSGGADAKTLHRIEAETVIAQAKAAGFILEGRSEVLADAQDDHSKLIFAPEIKGHTDKFVLKFRKPKMYTFLQNKHTDQKTP